MPDWSSEQVQQQLSAALDQVMFDKLNDLIAKDIQDSFMPEAWQWAVEHDIKLPEGDLDSQLAYLHIHYPEAFL